MRLLIISPDKDLTAHLESLIPHVENLNAVDFLGSYPSPVQVSEILSSKRPSAVIVSLAEAAPAVGIIETVSSYRHIVTLAAHSVNSPEMALTALRAGAFEYIGPPFEPGQLLRALQRAQGDTGSAPHRGRLIAFLPSHGGSGASTISLHVADAISSLGDGNVLLADFDSHSGALEFRMQLKAEFNLADALRRDSALDRNVWRKLAARWRNIEILAPPNEPFLSSQIYDRMSPVLQSAREVYSWVIADLPPAIYTSCLDVLGQAETVYLVCTPEPVSLHLAHRRARELRKLGIPKDCLKLIVNRLTSEYQLKPEEVQQLVDLPVAWGLRNDYKGLAEATMNGRPVSETSQLGRQFTGLACQVMGIASPQPAGSKGWSKFVSGVSRVFRPRPNELGDKNGPIGATT
jgi:Flp pilus assembly CpaE family ATPase